VASRASAIARVVRAAPSLPDAASCLASLSTWRQAGVARQAAVLQSIASALGAEYEALAARVGNEHLGVVKHRPTGLELVAIPGGTFTMGLREEELDEIVRLAPAELADDLRALAPGARPTHFVQVDAFLCARAPLSRGQAERVLGPLDADVERPEMGDGPDVIAYLSRAEAARAARSFGLRVVCEAEWEYLARDGGIASWAVAPVRSPDPNRAVAVRALCRAPVYSARAPAATMNSFGIWGLLAGEWTADAWHPTYAKAPERAEAWAARGAGPHLEVVRAAGCSVAWPWQNDDEFVSCHAAMRANYRHLDAAWALRFAVDLPASLRAQPLRVIKATTAATTRKAASKPTSARAARPVRGAKAAARAPKGVKGAKQAVRAAEGVKGAKQAVRAAEGVKGAKQAVRAAEGVKGAKQAVRAAEGSARVRR
jgi:formylglycine-generating enzyme required for sulfatase activity